MKLLAREVTIFEKAYALLQGILLGPTIPSEVMIKEHQCLDPPSAQRYRSSTHPTPDRNDLKGKSLNGTTKIKSNFFKINTNAKCYKCQGYDHMAINYPSLIKISIIDGAPIEAFEFD